MSGGGENPNMGKVGLLPSEDQSNEKRFAL
jgi:hypothetical protein